MEKQSEVPEHFEALVSRFKVLPEPQRYIQPYEYVRDLAYGDIGSRNPFDVLLASKGTCSGKHALLKLFFEALGYDVQSFFALHNFGNFPVRPWPIELSEFKGGDIPDYHDFLKVKIGNNWFVVDAVFDTDIVPLGFPKLEWDGKSDMELPVHTSDVFPSEGDMEAHKKKLIAQLPEDQQVLRKRFLNNLTRWIDDKRKKVS